MDDDRGDRGPARERLLEAAYECVGRWGIAKTTMDDVAKAARLSRATVYRYFPGGKEQLVREVVTWEAGRFFGRLAQAVAGSADLAGLLEEALVFAHRAVQEHHVLQKILQTEPGLLLPHLTVENDRLLALVRAFLRPHVDGEDADYVARMLLSFIGAQGGWDLTDRGEVGQIVRTQLLAGIGAQ